jgi:Ca2+-binding RTX toxin-like protein
MTTYVTVPGAGGTNIVNPYNNNFNTQVAQAISNYLFGLKNQNKLVFSNPPVLSDSGQVNNPPAPPPSGDVGEITVTTPGGGFTYVVVPPGYSVTAIDQSVIGPVQIVGGGSLFGYNQEISYTGAPAPGQVSISAGDGNDYFNLPSGSNYVVGLGNGNDTVYANGHGTVVGGTGNNYFNAGSQGESNLIVSHGNNDTIDAGAGTVSVESYGTDPQISGGVGNLIYLGNAAGSPTITGAKGTGMETLFGGAGQNITYLDNKGGSTPGSAILAAGAGNETLNAGGSSTGVQLAAGIGSVDMIGSTGPDTFYGGAGYATMTGNGGNDVFVFGTTPAGHQGGTDIITDFNSNDTFLLSGYGANAASTAFADATVTGGNSFVKLSDGTSIEFLGVNTTTGTWKTQSF